MPVGWVRNSIRLGWGCLLAIALAAGSAAAPAGATSFAYSGAPFASATATYLGTVIGGERGYPYGDLQPSIMYEPGDIGRQYKMWWLGRYRPGEPDLPPSNLYASDRIYYSYSSDGSSWSTPQVVLKGRGASTGEDTADDHLVGSPSVLKINGTYYMFYEAYGKWTTTIVRSWDSWRADNWVTSGEAWDSSSHEEHQFEKVLGIAPALVKAGTIPIYSGYVIYPNAKLNNFLDRSTAKCSQGKLPNGEQWVCRHQEEGVPRPVFWLYTANGSGRTPIYECFDTSLSNTFSTSDPGCDGHGVPGAPDGGSYLLGYADAVTPSANGEPVAQTAPDLANSNQNRIMLATSTDGVHWTRFKGGEPGGAVIAPQKAFTSAYPNNCGSGTSRDLAKAYGSGYPVALEREGFLELYFTDDSLSPVSSCARALGQWRIRIPTSELANPKAYAAATRQPNAQYGDDMKWSPLRHRYFQAYREEGPGSFTEAGFLQSPMLQWSSVDPPPNEPAQFPAEPDSPQNQLFRPLEQSRLPTDWSPNDFSDRIGGVGGLAGDALGHTLDYETPDSTDPPGTLEYSAYHIFYQAQSNAFPESPFRSDLDHLLIIGYDQEPSKYRLIAKHSGKCIDVVGYSNEPGAGIQQWSCRPELEALNQIFYLKQISPPYYQVVSKNSGLCLDVTAASTSPGARLQQYNCLGAGQANQLWKLEPVGGGYDQLIAKHSGQCADVTGGSLEDGARLQQYPCLGAGQANQLWKIESLE